MLGSYGPKPDSQEANMPTEQVGRGSGSALALAPSLFLTLFHTPAVQMPSGMIARGHYVVKSKFVDDDNETHLEWEWLVWAGSVNDGAPPGLLTLHSCPLSLSPSPPPPFSLPRAFDLKKEW